MKTLKNILIFAGALALAAFVASLAGIALTGVCAGTVFVGHSAAIAVDWFYKTAGELWTYALFSWAMFTALVLFRLREKGAW